MKNLMNLKGIEVLSKKEQKSIRGGEPVEACYCPETNIFAGFGRASEGGCAVIIGQHCPLES
ncbi:hypothetical protein [Flavobacterium hercynium]|uniref:Uncharacterized protein n=1 Tax=Flavobacterium hercynium TaxID=387094 RepID=A0A226HF27_9FLAO|nr:hypothetical protein [Flavobacterium hercynium]OXA92752.1 hypothetical protein B0A66_08195 [Flavobacterium hercynium]SMP01647.1 hypothetical protein SAMN06265346_10166 [Flavobacterium hercynium]